MDPFAHLEELKLIGMLVLGFFCYRQLRKVCDQPAEEEISDDSVIDEVQEKQGLDGSSAGKALEDPMEDCKVEDSVSKGLNENGCEAEVQGLKELSDGLELEKESSTARHERRLKSRKRRQIRKSRRNSKRPIRRTRNLSKLESKPTAQNEKIEVMV